MVSVSVRLLIASATRSGTTENTFAAVALSVHKLEVKTFKEFKEALSKVIIGDSDFKLAFSNARSSKADYARYYLRALECGFSEEKQPWYIINDDQSDITLEHILPKNREKGGWNEFNEEDFNKFSKRLGNLCLLQKDTNSTINNDSFVNKKPVFCNSPLHFTKNVSTYESWGPNEIENRQSLMADCAIKTWPV